MDSSALASSQSFSIFLSPPPPLTHGEPSTASAPVSIVTLSPTQAHHNQVNGIRVGVGEGTGSRGCRRNGQDENDLKKKKGQTARDKGANNE